MKKIITILFNYISLGMPCLFHKLTGFYCPGCGGTRSVMALLDGHIWQSFIYHPLPIYIIVAVVVNLAGAIIRKEKYHFSHKWIWSALIIVLVNLAIKNAALVYGIDLLNI